VTVLFTDIVNSTRIAAELGDRKWRALLNDHDAIVERQLLRFRGRAIKHTGDGYLAVFDGPARAIQSASSIRDAARRLGLEIRSGLHTGECDVRGEDLSGIAVHIGARIGAKAGPGEILVSGSIPPLVAGSGIGFIDLGLHELKGVPGTWPVFEVRG
jgi:class 3 adenylate cyclase